jgi:hypothetical protein
MSRHRERALRKKGAYCHIDGCEVEGKENTHIHHIDGDRRNGSPENLLPVCSDHHRTIHTEGDDLAEWTSRLLPSGEREGGNMSMVLTDERTEAMRRVMDTTEAETKAGVIDSVAAHYLADLENKKRVADDLPADLAADLSTPWLPIERETWVGCFDD